MYKRQRYVIISSVYEGYEEKNEGNNVCGKRRWVTKNICQSDITCLDSPISSQFITRFGNDTEGRQNRLAASTRRR